MKYTNKLASILGATALGMFAMTSCEGGDLYEIDSPDWIAQRVDSIKNSKVPEKEEELEGMMEDVYTIGATDFSTGWWAQFSKYYVIPDGQVWNAQFQLNINPSASNTYKNFALIICNDADRGSNVEYGAIRFDHQPSGNSEWGEYINRDNVESTLTFGSDTDAGVEKLGGKVTLTIDRTENNFRVKMSNGTVVKTYNHKGALPNLNSDESNTNIRAFLVPEGSFINFLATNIEPIGGCTSAEDKQPLKLTLQGVPEEVLLGDSIKNAMAKVTGVVEFEEGVTKNVTFDDLQLEAIPDMETLGSKTLVAIYNKTFKGENCATPVIAYATFAVVDEITPFTQKVVFPQPSVLGSEDNTTPWWSVFTENIKVEPKQTVFVTFTNYSDCINNWDNFCVILNKEDISAEYAVVRADNFGWGTGYAGNANLVTTIEDGRNWDEWRAAMDGAKVTLTITNNGDGSADIKAVMIGNDGNTYTQEYLGINGIDKKDLYFRFVCEGSHLVFDKAGEVFEVHPQPSVIGSEDNVTPWWTAFTDNEKIAPGKTAKVSFTNYSDCVNNWDNFCVILNKQDIAAEYAVVRADNFGWGAGYDGNENRVNIMEDGRDWDAWRAAMDGAKVTLTIANNGDGTVDIKATMLGNDGNTYKQEYNGICGIIPTDLYFRFVCEGSHLVFE